MNTLSQNKKRVYWIDALRGLAMLFVIIGHNCAGATEYFVLTSPIKIPLFFAITGYVMNIRGGDTKGFFKNLFWKLAIPWFCLSLLPLKLCKALIQLSSSTAGRYLYEFVSGGILWYMPCCILAEIMQFFIRKHCKGPIRYGVMLLISSAGLMLSRYQIAGFAGFNTACIAQAFIMLGLFLREVRIEQKKAVAATGFLLYAAGVALTLILFPDQCLDVHTNSYYSLPICIMMILTGCTLCFLLAERADKQWSFSKRNPLVFIGQNTLVFYMLSSYVIKVWNKGMAFLRIDVPQGPMKVVLNTIVMCAGCAAIAMLFNRFIPVIVGKKNAQSIFRKKAH